MSSVAKTDKDSIKQKTGLVLKAPSISSLKMVKIQLSGMQDDEKLSCRICEGGGEHQRRLHRGGISVTLEGQSGVERIVCVQEKEYSRDMNSMSKVH